MLLQYPYCNVVAIKAGKVILYNKEYTRQFASKIECNNQQQKKGALVVFEDNIPDKGNPNKARKHWDGQAKHIGGNKWGFGIVTRYYRPHKRPDLNEFKHDKNLEFQELINHIKNGGDVIIPVADQDDINKNVKSYIHPSGQGKNGVIFHNLGTGIGELPFEYKYIIQTFILNLIEISSETMVTSEYKYLPITTPREVLITGVPTRFHSFTQNVMFHKVIFVSILMK